MGAEGLLSGWQSAVKPLLSPLSLLQMHANTSPHTESNSVILIQVNYTVQKTHVKKFICQHRFEYAGHCHRNQRIKVLL